MSVKFITCTPDAEKIVAYCARVSSPFQDNPQYEGLIKYCWVHKHLSIFEQADMTLEITTSRAISAQIIRHRSFHFQEFSQRYSQAMTMEPVEIRGQDKKNRQSSVEYSNTKLADYYLQSIHEQNKLALDLYNDMVSDGIAKEVARFVLPMSTTTKLYMKGNLRDWINYINVRTDSSTQKEHRMIAQKCKDIFIKQFPTISASVWEEDCDSLDSTTVL